MNFLKKTLNASYFSSIEEIPKETWKALNCFGNLYFNPKYLAAIAKNHKNIQFHYIVLHDRNGNPVAFSTIQIVDFSMNSVQNNDLFSLETIQCIFEKLHIISSKKPIKILTSGNTFVSGEHGLFIKEGQKKQTIIKELAKSVVHFVNSDPILKKEVKAYMLKDFVKESLIVTDELLEENYHSFNVEPNMLMSLDSDWNTFDDYLAAMKTKFRVKAKRAQKLSLPLETKWISAETLEEDIENMTTLYNNVSSKADFNLGKFDLHSFLDLKNNLGENYIIKAYYLKDELVGFLSAMINIDSLDTHFVGLNYNYNREYAIYQRILYDYVDFAIENKIKFINFGRTASEIKSSIGAVPQELTIYVRHKNSLPNKLFSLFLNKIKPTPFNQKLPFKDKKIAVKS